MKKISTYLVTLIILWCIGCSENDGVGKIAPLIPEYELPQGKSPADDRIVEYYNQYGSYILYDYTKLDFQYDLFSSSGSYTYALPDPQYVGDMLDLLEDIWFDFYPVAFHKNICLLSCFFQDVFQMNYPMGSSVSSVEMFSYLWEIPVILVSVRTH